MHFNFANIGKIQKADIELKPLTIFIGKNGSGKTYAATALWTVISYIKKQTVRQLLSRKVYQNLENTFYATLEKLSNASATELSISLQELEDIVNEVNNHLQKNFSELLKRTFNADVFQEATLSLRNEILEPLRVYFRVIKKNQLLIDKEEHTGAQLDITFLLTETYRQGYKFSSSAINELLLPRSSGVLRDSATSEQILNFLIKEVIEIAVFYRLSKQFTRLMYMPAARTGLMFGYHNIVQNDFRKNNEQWSLQVESINRDNAELTMPLKSFVADLNDIRHYQSYHQNPELINPLETQLMDGNICINQDKQVYEFKPEGLQKPLPLSASSSLVTELAALSIQYNQLNNHSSFVIFEEPEAHLHLSAQREMAKLIVGLVNQGTYVLLTSHSDTFLQQINNLVLLNGLQDQALLEQLQIKDYETLSAEKVALYDFKVEEGKTNVQRIECGEYGFVAPSINEELFQLLQETNLILDRVSKDEQGTAVTTDKEGS